MTETNPTDSASTNVARTPVAPPGPVSADAPVEADLVDLRVVAGADRFAYYIKTVHEDGGETEQVAHVGSQPTPVPADAVEHIIDSAASVGVTIQKVEE